MTDYLLLFSAGLLGALHCMGMCGGLIMACGMKFGGGPGFSLIYNTGRVFSYVLLGLFMGLLGKALIAVGLFGKFQGALPIITGLIMVMIGLDLLGYLPEKVKKATYGLFPKKLSDIIVGSQLKKRESAPFILGMLNGLIPCGLLYAIGVKAASTADPFQGALTMAAFGSGTLPALLLAGSFSKVMNTFRTRTLINLSSILVISLGIKSVIYGMGYMKIFLFL